MSGKKTSTSKKKCSFCGCTYETFSFKHGYVCDGCLQYIKSYNPESGKSAISRPAVNSEIDNQTAYLETDIPEADSDDQP